MKPLLVKSEYELPLFLGTIVPLGKNHSPTFPPSLVLQHRVLTLLVTHTRDEAAPSCVCAVNAPMSVMSTEWPGRYTLPFSVKYRP